MMGELAHACGISTHTHTRAPASRSSEQRLARHRSLRTLRSRLAKQYARVWHLRLAALDGRQVLLGTSLEVGLPPSAYADSFTGSSPHLALPAERHSEHAKQSISLATLSHSTLDRASRKRRLAARLERARKNETIMKITRNR
jgi:hypothetical protein